MGCPKDGFPKADVGAAPPPNAEGVEPAKAPKPDGFPNGDAFADAPNAEPEPIVPALIPDDGPAPVWPVAWLYSCCGFDFAELTV